RTRVKKAMKCVKAGMSPLEKALVLHDYLIANTQYLEEESKEYRYSEWGVFLKGKANCQGYSMAYSILMQEAGIPVRCVVSEEMLHMWNQIKIGGKWYHVDVTWDDPLDTRLKKDQYGLVLHDRFLCSTQKMKEKGYYGFQAKSAKSTKYDNKFWTEITSEIFYRSGKWLYQTDRRIEQRNSLVKGKAKPLYWAGGNYFISLDKNRYYFINYNRIYLYQRKKQKMYLVLDGNKRYKGKTSISQLKCDSGKLTYRVVKNDRVKTVSKRINKKGLLAK
ncbi:MAG: transglutaminase-like domain-containing protein, partial [Lachnospiraceae bacterium]|nr:transglutaminase-like domain-containing protein [Lachnospiraceae bacterium]